MHFVRYCYLSRNGYLLLIIFTILLLFIGGCKKHPMLPEPPNPEESIILVVNGLGETLSIIHLDNGEVDNDVLTLGLWTNHIVVNSNGDVAYVVNSGENNIQVIDLYLLETVCMIDVGVGQNPYHLATTDTLGFVTNLLTNTVSVINFKEYKVVDTIYVGVAPEGVLIQGNKAYVTNTGYSYGGYGQGTVSVIDINTMQVELVIDVPTNPQEIVSDPIGNLHVVCTGNYMDSTSGKIVIINPEINCVIDTVVLGGSPSDVVFTAGGKAYVVGYWGGLMSYDWQKNQVLHNAFNPIVKDDGFMNIELDTVENCIYLCDFDDDRILVVDLTDESIVNEYKVGDGPVCITVRQ
ncbi:hypothetical protein KAX75_04705 [candidate division WOR-3 bacterium]|nr:hypothetical protein [candidate division WOR-3 bacterium]